MSVADNLLAAAAVYFAWMCTALAAGPTSTGLFPSGITPPQAVPFRGIAVVGGTPTTDRKIVGIVFNQGGEERVCSGLYISAKRILTAAHCTCGSENFRISNESFINGGFRRAELVSRFGNYDCKNASYLPEGDDLALLSIGDRLKATDLDLTCIGYSILPEIRLGARWFPVPPEYVSVAGYGFSGVNAENLGTRQEAVVSLNSALCGSQVAKRLSCRPFTEFIAGNTPVRGRLRDTCRGDSGGPAFFRVKGQFIPFGIVSRGLPLPQSFSAADCGSGGIYTHIGRKDVIAWLIRNEVPALSEQCDGSVLE